MPMVLDIPKRSEVIRSHKEDGGGVAAVYPIHYPRALLRAFNLLPVEVWGPPGRDTTEGDAHLQAYTCSIVRCGLSFLLSGGLEVADVIISPHGCDSLQGLGSLLLDFTRPKQPVLPLYIPRGNRRSDVQYLAAEMRRTYDKLARLLDRHPSEEDLLSCTEREERADQVLGELLFKRSELPLSNRSFYTLVRAREYLPAETFEALGRTALKRADGAPRRGVPVLLSGLVPEPMTLLDALDDAGATVVADDMASTGRRVYPGGSSSDPFDRMAQRLLGGPPDPTRGCSIQERRTHLVNLARKTGARGAIFLEIKFCEPELFYLPLMREGLQRADIRSVSIEVDIADPLPDQVVTRLEAFVETIQ